jgi:hypothetical protein
MKRITILLAALVVSAALGLPQVAAAAESRATSGAGGIFPPDASFTGVTLNALQLGTGAEVNPDSSGLGQFTAVLLGVSGLGLEQNITIEGEVTGGSRNAANVVILSGTSILDLGDGTPPTPGVPFTATLTSDGSGLGIVGLVIGATTLANATLNAGSLTIE